jgi:PleD family two-component response regulator
MAPQTALQVLVVDDDPGILSGLTRLLQRDGHTVETATNGQEALALLQTFYVKPSICRTTRRCSYAPYKLSAQPTSWRLSCSICRASSYGSPDDHTAYTILAHFCPRPRKIVACA